MQDQLDARNVEIVTVIENSCQDLLSREIVDEIKENAITLFKGIDMNKGKATSWACGIVHAILYKKELFNKELKASDIYKAFEVSSSTALSKSKEIRIFIEENSDILDEVALTIDNDEKLIDEVVNELIAQTNIVYDGKYKDATLEEANNIADMAWKEKNFKTKVKLANEALNLNEKCAEAYLILSYNESISSKERIEMVKKASDIAKEVIGEENLQGYVGRFLNFSLTKPYISAKYRLASLLWIDGAKKEAINELVGILELCPEDSLMIRGILASYLLEEGMETELESLLTKFNSDYLTSIKYTKALYTFLKEGPSEEANRALRIANLANGFVTDYITRKKRLPKVLPELKKLGSEEDAIYYMKNAESTWRKYPKAVEWVKEAKKQNN